MIKLIALLFLFVGVFLSGVYLIVDEYKNYTENAKALIYYLGIVCTIALWSILTGVIK